MDPDRDRSAKDIEQEMEDEAARMERRLDKLDGHVEDAAKKAKETRKQTVVESDEPLDTVAGDASERSTASDDPASAVGDPADADES